MIARLRGETIELRLSQIVLEVSGIGYLIAVRNPSDFDINDQVSLHTHLAVRETAMDLYGFELEEELQIFTLLLKLPKIGPKSAMQILSQADIELLKKAVITNDPTYLSKMSVRLWFLDIEDDTENEVIREVSKAEALEKFDDLTRRAEVMMTTNRFPPNPSWRCRNCHFSRNNGGKCEF